MSKSLCQNQAEAPLRGDRREKVPGVVTPLLHTGSPLSHCHWTEFTVQDKTTDKEETVRPSRNSWHALERRATLKATQGMFL